MIVHIWPAERSVLEESNVFSRFKAIVHCPKAVFAMMDGRRLDCGKRDADGIHVWIDPDWLRSNGPGVSQWYAGFEGLLALAEKQDWLDEAGYIRAHVEFAG